MKAENPSTGKRSRRRSIHVLDSPILVPKIGKTNLRVSEIKENLRTCADGVMVKQISYQSKSPTSDIKIPPPPVERTPSKTFNSPTRFDQFFCSKKYARTGREKENGLRILYKEKSLKTDHFGVPKI